MVQIKVPEGKVLVQSFKVKTAYGSSNLQNAMISDELYHVIFKMLVSNEMPQPDAASDTPEAQVPAYPG